MKFKKIAVPFLIALIPVLITCFRYSSRAPERTASALLEAIVTDNPTEALSREAEDQGLEAYTEHCVQRYQSFFTEEAFMQAIRIRTFALFLQPVSDEFHIPDSSSIRLERLEYSKTDVSLFGTIETVYEDADLSSFSKEWNASIRLTKERGSWKICYLLITPGD